MRERLYTITLLFLMILPIGFSTNSYEIQLVVSKYVHGPLENVSVTGTLINISTNSTINTTSYVNGGNITVYLRNDTNNATLNTYTFLTNENGTFFTRNSFNPSAQQILSPNATGTFILTANYSSSTSASANIVVVSNKVDDMLFQLLKVNFYTSENMTVTVKSVQRVGDSLLAVANITVNMTMRHTNDSSISASSCVTGNTGACSVNMTALSSSGTYLLEANNFVGFTNFNVVPFDVEAYMRDSSALTFKNIFARSESGFVEVRVSYNSTSPTGTYNASAQVFDTNGVNVLNMSSVLLNSTNGFVDKIPFTITSSINVGFYNVKISVSKTGGETVNETTNFQVRDWSLTFTKAAQGSGFEYGYTAFLNTTVFFEVYPIERANGTVIENLTSNITVLLKNNIGSIVGNRTVAYNATCSAKACYQFNLTTPVITGDYTLTVGLNHSSDYQAADRTIKITDITASAQPSDSEGTLKELFGTTEFVYISLSGKNKTSNITIYDADVVNVIYENGTSISYSEANLTSMNLSDSTFKWTWNSSSSRLVIDPPKTGGVYLIEIYVNNNSAAVTTRFGVKPYDVCLSAKGSSDTSSSDYWYQFRTSDTIYFHVKINEAQNTVGRATIGNASGFSSTYGRSSQCSFDTTKKRAVNNATITVQSVLNMQSGNTESLNTSSTCSSVDNSGGYLCTVRAADGMWDGGRHVVTLSVLGDDRATTQYGNGFFEARAFYMYGYSSNWANKGNSSITLNLNAYEAGSGWWSSSNGLSGTAVVDSINYYGGVGEWIWPPIKYNYNVTGLNITITNGVGSITLTPNRTSGGTWPTGYYSAVMKATINNQVDYGEAWFSIRNWDAYATPVEIVGTSYESKGSINSKQNISLYVRITEASNYNDNGAGLLGSLTIKVKKIIDYSQSPAVELTSSNFTSNVLTVNESSPWYSNANTTRHNKFIINITPTSGTWENGYYSVILDINNTESGYGWFNAVTFYVSAQTTNSAGSSIYNSKGNLPIYFNVTTTKSQTSTYTSADFINATITDAIVRLWDQTTQTQMEFKYPAQINITPLLVNGSGIINMTYLGGNWPTGYYSGELKMYNNVENTTAKGWIWFSIQPFRVSSTTTSYNVGTRENVTVNININEPDWSNNAFLNGTYIISSVQDTTWTNGVYSVVSLNYTYNGTNGIFNDSTTLKINPSGGKWKPGYRNGMITVKNNLTNETQTTWFSFRATSFTDTMNRTSNVNSGTGSNVTVNITLTAPGGGQTDGNLSIVYSGSSYSKTPYRFLIGSCDSLTSSSCLINRSAIVTVVAPAGGWNEGYNYLYFQFIETDDSTALVESYNNVYFNVKQTISGYMYSVNSQGWWQNSFGNRENVTMYIYSLQNLSGSSINVTVTNVQVAKTSSNCWTDSCRSYSSVTFEVMNLSSGVFLNSGSSKINVTGFVRMNASGGSWELGEYAVKISMTDNASGESGVIKDATFRVIDKTSPAVLITSPTAEQIINASSITFTATTSEQANCNVYLYDYKTFDSYYCLANNTNTSSYTAACNGTKYNNITASNYSAYASKWWSNSGNMVSTDSTSHSYAHPTSSMPSNQNYTVKFDCYDSDWNYATNATTFNLLASGGISNVTLTINVSYPTNTTYTTATLNLNYTVIGTPSNCWAEINAANTTPLGCANMSMSANQGSNRVKVFTNNSLGTIFSTAPLYFSVDSLGPNITFVSPTPGNGSTVNASYVHVNVTLDEVPDFIRFEFNGTNYTMTNLSSTRLTWFRNQTGLNSSTYVFRVFANDTFNGNMSSTSRRTIVLNSSG